MGVGRKPLTTLTVKKGPTAFAFHIYGVGTYPGDVGG